MSSAVAVIWTVTLILAYLAVPLLLMLLWRIVHAAGKIERYSRDTRAASRDITRHLEALPALDTTETLLRGARSLGAEIARGAESLAGLLAQRARGRS